jgi:hypothetical protein
VIPRKARVRHPVRQIGQWPTTRTFQPEKPGGAAGAVLSVYAWMLGLLANFGDRNEMGKDFGEKAPLWRTVSVRPADSGTTPRPQRATISEQPEPARIAHPGNDLSTGDRLPTTVGYSGTTPHPRRAPNETTAGGDRIRGRRAFSAAPGATGWAGARTQRSPEAPARKALALLSLRATGGLCE